MNILSPSQQSRVENKVWLSVLLLLFDLCGMKDHGGV
jgi:hypothetical protein